jgi:hypothetical protein
MRTNHHQHHHHHHHISPTNVHQHHHHENTRQLTQNNEHMLLQLHSKEEVSQFHSKLIRSFWLFHPSDSCKLNGSPNKGLLLREREINVRHSLNSHLSFSTDRLREWTESWTVSFFLYRESATLAEVIASRGVILIKIISPMSPPLLELVITHCQEEQEGLLKDMKNYDYCCLHSP